jgi:hypothetical protein
VDGLSGVRMCGEWRDLSRGTIVVKYIEYSDLLVIGVRLRSLMNPLCQKLNWGGKLNTASGISCMFWLFDLLAR